MKMEFSDIEQETGDAKPRDVPMYQNTRIGTGTVVHAGEIENNEGIYEQLRRSTSQKESKANILKTEGKYDKWEEVPNKIKYAIYIISAMLVVLFIVDIVVIVIIALPKEKVHGNWSEWQEWASCSVSCGMGKQSRGRTCTSPAPKDSGDHCIGHSQEYRLCDNGSCGGHGNWSQWEEWGSCSVSSGMGMQSRDRTCTNPAPKGSGDHCFGNSQEYRLCDNGSCAVHGNWSEWEEWGSCSVSCGMGMQSRDRTCTNPAPKGSGEHCFGHSQQHRLCDTGPCGVNGNWSEWEEWGSCSVSCGMGMQSRGRTCTNPAPKGSGEHCFGHSQEYRLCDNGSCADGEWTLWGSWGSCSGGVRKRTRSCSSSSSSLFSRSCTGDSSDVSICNNQLNPDYNVAFTASNITDNSGTSNTVLQFSSVYLNNGDAYNTTTGKFTCKIPGVYYFAVTLTKLYMNLNYLDAFLRINGSNKLNIHFYPDDDNSNELVSFPLTTSGTFHLNTNDTVDVYGVPNYFINRFYSSFTGILVFPDQ